jgi:hypothetical protein
MNKYSAGRYFDNVNGFTVEVTKTVLDSGEIVWYNGIEYRGRTLFKGTDFYPTKKKAFDAIKYVAENPIQYNLIKHTD